MNAKYQLVVKDSKAIKDATIDLDTITVLAGVNASGKSTIARMIHQIVNLSATYPLLLEKMAWSNVKIWASQIGILGNRLENNAVGVLSSREDAGTSTQFDDELGKRPFSETIDKLQQYALTVFEKYQKRLTEGDAKRAFGAFVRAVGIGDEVASDVTKVLEIFRNKCQAAKQRYADCLRSRKYEAYNYASAMRYDLRWLTDAERVSFSEDGELVYAVHRLDDRRLSPDADLKEIFGLRQSFYIASPWVGLPHLSKDGSLTIKYDDFRHFPNSNVRVEESNFFEVLGGTIEPDESTGESRWIYHKKTSDKNIDLNDCATGIKALSILNILYTRGFLTSDTLLIIDEPEAHLHPQWVVEYARILVLIAKKYNVRMLLTSHNPDMVAALQEISEHENLEGVRFYLSEAKEDGYEYRSLDRNVEPIFKAFNKAIDAIETYESSDGE